MHINHIKVRGFHLDMYQHVNNARYLEFLEESRWAYFERHPLMEIIHARNCALVLVNIDINYRRPAFNDELLEIRTKVSRIGNKSCRFQQNIYLEGTETLIADAVATFCILDQETHTSVAINDEERALLEEMAL